MESNTPRRTRSQRPRRSRRVLCRRLRPIGDGQRNDCQPEAAHHDWSPAGGLRQRYCFEIAGGCRCLEAGYL
ncbi:hypothetical protein CLIM01_02966, partial [Colletotrichum limetticola]